MPLVSCQDCQFQVSDSAPACPRCGRPLPPAAAAAQRGLVASLLIVAVCGGIFYAFSLSLCNSMKSSSPTAPSIAIAPHPGSVANDEARDAVRALRVFWPIGDEAATGASQKFDHCHDDLKGFANLERCVDEVVSEAAAAEAKLPPAPIAKLACGKDIEAAHREYVPAAHRFTSDFLAWLRANKKRLAPAMAAKTLPDASEAFEDLWSTRPMEGDEDRYGKRWGASYARVMNVECTKTIFTCPLPVGNVCWINKVAKRLRLTPEEPPGERDSLQVAATGLEIVE